MTLGEFLNDFHVLMHDHVAIFRYDAWDGAPEFTCDFRYLKYSGECDDLFDKKVMGICSGHEYAMACLEDPEEQNIIEIALDWKGDE